MTNNSTFRRPLLALAISALIGFWSSVPFAAPVIGPFGGDEALIASQLLNEILRSRSNGDSRDGAVAVASNRVVELMNAARPKILAALMKAEISGELEVRAGTWFSGFIPTAGVSGSEHINLFIYQNGNKLGDLTVGKQYSGSSVTPYAEFKRVP